MKFHVKQQKQQQRRDVNLSLATLWKVDNEEECAAGYGFGDSYGRGWGYRNHEGRVCIGGHREFWVTTHPLLP
jgi:hypothetical protein